MALLFLGSFFEDLHHAPVRDDAKLDALAMQILDKDPKTLLGLVVRARAEKWLRRHLWTLAFDSLSPLEQGVRIVIDSAMRIDCDRPPAGLHVARRRHVDSEPRGRVTEAAIAIGGPQLQMGNSIRGNVANSEVCAG
jgi:hypothetical protein